MAPLPILVALLSAAAAARPAPGHPVALPVDLSENRFILTPRLPDGRTVRLYSDTGGGRSMLSPELVEAAGLPMERPDAGADSPPLTIWPRWVAGSSVPAPAGRPMVRATTELGPGLDGFLAQDWFAGRTWTFDYPGKRLLLRAPGDLPRGGRRVPFHLPKPGADTLAFGRLTIEIDGQPLEVLFDTGATTTVTPEAVQKLGDGAASRATSFMKAAIFDRWRAAHPGWPVVEKAEARTGADMIRVPFIVLAGQTVGPVWFTRRPDAAFDKFMSSMTDAPVVGALGGSGLRYVRVSVDYAQGVAVLESPPSTVP